MNKQAKKNVISEMIKQHEELKSDIVSVMDSVRQDNPNFTKAVADLVKFSNDLKIHVESENKLFYDELLREIKTAGQNTSGTEEFIAEMTNIGKVIFNFVERFSDAEKIKKDFANFKKEIVDIREILILRVESEETGVFAYWE